MTRNLSLRFIRQRKESQPDSNGKGKNNKGSKGNIMLQKWFLRNLIDEAIDIF